MLCLAVLGCGSDHLMLATTIQVEDLGTAFPAPSSAPVVAPSGTSVIYLRVSYPQAPTVFPVVSRDRVSQADVTLFNLPANSVLWTLNYPSGSLLCSIPDGPGGVPHIADYALDGALRMNYDVPAGSRDSHAAMSPDGSRLAFIRKNETTGFQHLVRRDASAGNSTTTQMGTFLNNETIHAVRWPDATHVFVSCVTDQAVLENFVWDTSTGVRSSASGLGPFSTPDPSGQRVVYLLGVGGTADLVMSRFNGDAATQLTRSATGKLGVNWAMDSRALVYVTIQPQSSIGGLELLLLPPLN